MLAVLLVIAAIATVDHFTPSTPRLPANMILSVDLTQNFADGPGEAAWLKLIAGAKPSLRDFLDAIEAAGTDPRVKGIVARVGDDAFGLAEVQQIRDTIAAFRAKGKFAIAFADSFGEFGGGTRPYYLATAFEPIWLQPMGIVGLTGLCSDAPYLRGRSTCWGSLPSSPIAAVQDRDQQLTETPMTPPEREQDEECCSRSAGRWWRNRPGTQINAADGPRAGRRGPLPANEALKAKLVDRIGYRDEVIAAAHKRAGSGAEIVDLSRYSIGRGANTRGSEDRADLWYGLMSA